MLVAVVEHFLDHVSEREFDAPFIALLLKLGFRDVHHLHGQYEFGKDFIARATEGGQQVQYVFQSKAGDLSLGDWSRGTPQLDLLRTNTLAHPAFDAALPRRPVLVLTGRLTGGAALAVQNYCDQARGSGIGLEIWDRESLVERIAGGLDIGVERRTEGPLLTLIGAIDEGSIAEVQVERFSRRWMSTEADASACTLEAATVAARIERHRGAECDAPADRAVAGRRHRLRRRPLVRGGRPHGLRAFLGRTVYLLRADRAWRRGAHGVHGDDVRSDRHEGRLARRELADSVRRGRRGHRRLVAGRGKQSVIENMAPVLTRLFTPLFTILLLVFLGTMAWTGRPIDIKRNVLIAFDLLLALVVGLVLYSASARDPEAPPNLFDRLQLLLIVSALVVDTVALAAIASRISEFGFTPNRVAALGENLILLVNLAWSAWLYAAFLRGRQPLLALEVWQTAYLPVYSIWAALVVVVFPPLFAYA